MADAKILVVDDDRVTRSIVVTAIEQAGYRTGEATNAEDAREQLENESFAAVLCDVIMPGETGFSLVAYIRRQHPDLPVVLITGIADAQLVKRTMELGVSGCIEKPFEPDQVVAELRQALESAG